jgi:hypothetical protein
MTRGIIEGLLIRSGCTVYNKTGISNEQFLTEAWGKVQCISFSIYALYKYKLCYKAFELMIDLVGEEKLAGLGLPATKQEVLDFLETKRPNLSPDQEVIIGLSSQLALCEEKLLSAQRFREHLSCQLSNIIFPNQPYDFNKLSQELKRLKIQDLNLQIPLKKQELAELTNNLKNNLGSAGKYLLDKAIKKQTKFLLNNETDSGKLEEIKQVIGEELNTNRERLQELLDKQIELFNLEKHLAFVKE